MAARECAFCTLPADRVVRQSDLCLAIRDGYPVSPNHTLVIPKLHVARALGRAKI
jgi:diadenosine tetraphosphate (Ap4A) HIT family hydrolase